MEAEFQLGHTKCRKLLGGLPKKYDRYILIVNVKVVQFPLGFATLDKAAALGLATATPLTDLRQYINSNLGYSDLKICFL